MARLRSRRGGTNLGLFLLFGQIMQIGINNMPPITIMTVALNVLIYLNYIPSLPSVSNACTSNQFVFQRKEWKRLFYSSFYHLDDMHLYFNMVSFISKGMSLERKIKSRKFIFLIALFAILTQIVMLAINQLFAKLFLSNYYLNTCAVGFSAVCFALKVVASANTSGTTYLTGIPMPVPLRHAHWFELVLIQILVPNASFTGHLAGIVVGLLYTHGPFERIIKAFDDFIFKDAPSRSYHHQSQRSGYRFSGLSDDELLQEGIRESLKTHHFQPYPARAVHDKDDQDLQEAIRRSLNRTDNQQPPSYGWNIPHTDYHDDNYQNCDGYSTSNTGNSKTLYPDLSHINNDKDDSGASAPPYPIDEFTGRPGSHSVGHYQSSFNQTDMYNSSHNPPYPVVDISSRPSLRSVNENTLVHRHKPVDDNTIDQNAVRKARVKRFAMQNK